MSTVGGGGGIHDWATLVLEDTHLSDRLVRLKSNQIHVHVDLHVF